MLDGGTKHDGLAVLAKPVPVSDYVTNDRHATLFSGLVCPLTACGGRTSHVGLMAREDSHGHQYAVLRQVVHGGGVDQVGEYLAQACSEGCG